MKPMKNMKFMKKGSFSFSRRTYFFMFFMVLHALHVFLLVR
jgi:hypothetical protein